MSCSSYQHCTDCVPTPGSGQVLTAGGGDRSARPQRSQLVTVHLSARLEDGRPAAGPPERLTFGLGDGEVITGLDMAVGLMQPGETADVYMDARSVRAARPPGGRPTRKQGRKHRHWVSVMDVYCVGLQVLVG